MEDVENIILNLKRPEWTKTVIPVIVDEIMTKVLNTLMAIVDEIMTKVLNTLMAIFRRERVYKIALVTMLLIIVM